MKKLKNRKLTLRKETLAYLQLSTVTGGTSGDVACAGLGEDDGGNSGYVTCVTCNNAACPPTYDCHSHGTPC